MADLAHGTVRAMTRKKARAKPVCAVVQGTGRDAMAARFGGKIHRSLKVVDRLLYLPSAGRVERAAQPPARPSRSKADRRHRETVLSHKGSEQARIRGIRWMGQFQAIQPLSASGNRRPFRQTPLGLTGDTAVSRSPKQRGDNRRPVHTHRPSLSCTRVPIPTVGPLGDPRDQRGSRTLLGSA